MKERIQKLLAHAGYGSRRQIERWIEAGDIQVNGQTATLGQQISVHDKVILQGKTLHIASRVKATSKVLLYHKKAGEMCTRKDPEGRPTAFDNLPRLKQGRWVMIGRLDVNTDGLLMFTTDGELANRLMHPSYEIEREYSSRVLGKVTPEMLENLTKGVELEDGKAQFLRIKDGGGEGANHWYNVVIKEGKNREVRRLWESQGIKVSRLIRIRYGETTLPRYLRQGHHEELDVRATRKLYQSVGLEFEDGSQEQSRPKSRTQSTSHKPRTQNTSSKQPRTSKPSPKSKKRPQSRRPR